MIAVVVMVGVVVAVAVRFCAILIIDYWYCYYGDGAEFPSLGCYSKVHVTWFSDVFSIVQCYCSEAILGYVGLVPSDCSTGRAVSSANVRCQHRSWSASTQDGRPDCMFVPFL